MNDIDDPRYAKALSHPLRVRILALLHERVASPVELVERLDATLGTVSYHVRLLRELGLIELVDETRVRGAIEHHYRAKERPTISEEAWVNAPPAAKQAAVGAALQTIDDYLRASAAAGGFDRPEAHLTRSLVRLDGKGWRQLARAATRLVEQVERIEGAAAKRLEHDSHAADVVDVGFALMIFEAVRLSDTATARDGTRSGGRRSSKQSGDASRRGPVLD